MAKGLCGARGKPTPPQGGTRERTTGNTLTASGASASPMQRSREGQLRVLAVDPDPVSRSHTWTMLLDEGFEAVVTGDPDRVEYLAGTERPHLFLVDAGPEIMERIARESDGPVLFMLEHGTVPEIERALGPGSRRLHPQALHPAGACGENQDGRAERARTRSAGVPGTIRAGRADHRLRGTHGNRRQRPGPTDGDRVQPAIRALHERGGDAHPRTPSERGLGTAPPGGRPGVAHLHQGAAPETGGRPLESQVHLHGHPGRIPDAKSLRDIASPGYSAPDGSPVTVILHTLPQSLQSSPTARRYRQTSQHSHAFSPHIFTPGSPCSATIVCCRKSVWQEVWRGP